MITKKVQNIRMLLFMLLSDKIHEGLLTCYLNFAKMFERKRLTKVKYDGYKTLYNRFSERFNAYSNVRQLL